MDDPTKIFVRAVQDVTVVEFSKGATFDAVAAQELGQELYDLVDTQACEKLILNFSGVQFLSSAALGVLITLRKKSEAIKGKVIFCGLRAELHKIFTLTRIDTLFAFEEDEEKALADFGVTATP